MTFRNWPRIFLDLVDAGVSHEVLVDMIREAVRLEATVGQAQQELHEFRRAITAP